MCISIDSPGTNLENVLARAELFGDHATLYYKDAKSCFIRKSIKLSSTDKHRFQENTSRLSITAIDGDLNAAASRISQRHYECAGNMNGALLARGEGDDGGSQGRWERLLGDADDARVWRVIS